MIYMTDPDRADLARAIRDAACDKRTVSDALMSLKREHRVVIVRAYYLRQSVATIAEYEQIPEGTVKSRLHYGLHALRNALQETGVVC
jgi:RNA polymerase sigma-70 factor (ECF subfamily)